MLTGWLYFRFVYDSDWRSSRSSIELPLWMTRKEAAKAVAYRVNVTEKPDIRAEVDRILDKINSDGLASLSAEEKRVLDEARSSIGRR